MLNISSSLSFIRNARGELIHTSPLFDKIFLTRTDVDSWFSSLPLETGMELVKSEINLLSERSACIVRDIRIDGFVWDVFIESLPVNNEFYSKWVFVRETYDVGFISNPFADVGRKIEKYISSLSFRKDDKWKILNLYAIGLTHSKISAITGVSEKTSRKVVSDFSKEFAFDSRDNLILSLFYSVSYHRLAMNIMDILKLCVNDLLR
ncbi:conjugal transfer protein TrbJ [Klebsiella aerogenes]|uniref:conjugal transfer protein TrbJ n=1 Tax=Klebsiella aerogenes TaxID=548 RepID=UPI00254D3A68|nr:conjugal transfer protein TrbJ [Klebsiella aerogenes]EKZ5287258.1 conjugal transfer protein TrbJ [Klebsiella aerogenes]MDK7100820.1 conjugal transfer protein TrbJ [Klebsiella aerogenes]MDK7645702.1 conjugal transfer protein TrbJ [Klebsiella aerogenes]MDK7850691.1 conjugal transfer protein TrbJ [Klebsiella aerogenes]MDK8313963.1 conjugal transfer protein TrbJ [Klebsiella aerogenes]